VNTILDAIVEAQKEFIRTNGGKEPTTLNIGICRAYDICKLGRNEIGPLADDLTRDGVKSLEKLFGMDVVIDRTDVERLELG